jgi:hypothetical protein
MKLLLTLQDNHIAPRFDLTTEVLIAEHISGQLNSEPRYIILPRKSAEDLCDLIVKEGVHCLVCGGIEDSLHKFFLWKKIDVIDNIIGTYAQALEGTLAGTLQPGSILPSARSIN